MPVAEYRIPRTVQEAVDHMSAALGPDEKELIRTAGEADLDFISA